MSGKMIEFRANGRTADGYLAIPDQPGPGLIVIQEWWGLVDHIKDLVNRFAAEGFVALAPDLFHGDMTKSPDQAGKLLMALNIEEAGRDLRGAARHLLKMQEVQPNKVGALGFCMGDSWRFTPQLNFRTRYQPRLISMAFTRTYRSPRKS